MSAKTPVLICWSGGKDSCVALHVLQRSESHLVTGLLTTMVQKADRISMHGVRGELLERQAAMLGLTLDRVFISAHASNDEYEEVMMAAFERHAAAGVRTVAFGDLHLKDIRAYRERMMKPARIEPIFPVWALATRNFVEDFISAGFRAVLVSVSLSVLDASFAGRLVDLDLIADLPPGVDPCGENGEFHTFVFDGPNFASAVNFEFGDRIIKDGFCFCDLIPA